MSRQSPPIPCVVCGEPCLKHWTCKTTGRVRHARSVHAQTCGEPECRAMIVLHPELIDQSRIVPRKHGHITKYRTIEQVLSRDNVEFVAAVVDGLMVDEAELEQKRTPDAELAQDRRWSAWSDELRDDPWSKVTRVSCMLRLIGTVGKASIIVHRKKPKEPVWRILQRSWKLRSTRTCDLFMAWRCPCEHDHRVQYERIQDFPSKLGYHDPCPLCGAAPLEVLKSD